MSYRLKHLYHTTMFVPDLEASAAFFGRVFGRKSVLLRDYLGAKPKDKPAGFQDDYATFTPIAEVQIECVDPTRLLIDGDQVHGDVTEPALGTLAWFVDDVEDAWAAMRARNLHGADQRRKVTEGDGPPRDVSGTPIIFTIAEETGLAYELCAYIARRDPRGDPPVPALSADDPLGIEACSHHTVLTSRPDRARAFLVDLLHGEVLSEGHNQLLATDSTYIALADAVVELAVPSPTSSAPTPGLEDIYYSLTWKVRDLDQVAKHLDSVGVGVTNRSDSTLLTDPADSLGVAWGFSTGFVAGDARGEG